MGGAPCRCAGDELTLQDTITLTLTRNPTSRKHGRASLTCLAGVPEDLPPYTTLCFSDLSKPTALQFVRHSCSHPSSKCVLLSDLHPQSFVFLQPPQWTLVTLSSHSPYAVSQPCTLLLITHSACFLPDFLILLFSPRLLHSSPASYLSCLPPASSLSSCSHDFYLLASNLLLDHVIAAIFSLL